MFLSCGSKFCKSRKIALILSAFSFITVLGFLGEDMTFFLIILDICFNASDMVFSILLKLGAGAPNRGPEATSELGAGAPN
jgi:hypothetical protein